MTQLQTYNGIDTYIFKTASFCNLNCSYCYYFNGADTSFHNKPKIMSREIIRETTNKIIQHSVAHGVPHLDLTLHGGEPLLMGKEEFSWMMQELSRINEADITARRKIQTNGVLLDEEWIDLLSENDVWVGISMDGPRLVHDQFRVDHAGRGSYDKVVRGLKLALNAPKGLRVSVLSVINHLYAGRDMYRHLRDLGVKRMDFLLPESNYAYPPYAFTPGQGETPFATFLNEVMEEWLTEDDPDTFVRLLNDILESFMDHTVKSDVIGGAAVQVAVIETDGSIEPTDNFKSCEDGMTNLGLNIMTHQFDDLYYHAFFDNCKLAAEKIPTKCRACRYVDKCAGGRVTTRYSKENGFDNPTIYCDDLILIYGNAERIVNDALQAQQVS